MITLVDWYNYAALIGIAAVCGGIGGFAFELLQPRGTQTGQVERPHGSRRYVDLGVWANVILGAVAAVAALYIFPPEVKTVVGAGEKVTTTHEYDVIKAIALSLIIGSAGSSFLSALQARVLAVVKDEQAKTTERVATDQITTLQDQIAAGESAEKLAVRAEGAKAAVLAVARGADPGS